MNATIHPTAIVDEGAQIGEDSRVWHWVHVCGGARIGWRGCSLGQKVFVRSRVAIGNNVKIQNLETLTLQSDYSGKFNALGVKHSVQAGLDAAAERAKARKAVCPAAWC